MSQLRMAWLRLRDSLWFVPALVVLVSIAAAIILVGVQSHMGDNLASDWPRVFGAGADGSRAMLSSIATSMVTVAGVVFSITIVTLSLSATQYSPRILRNFMRDRPTQLVLGIFMGVYAYCLVVLRTVRSGDLQFIPSLAVLIGMGYALVAIGFFIYFIHHVAQSIQASTIAAHIFDDTVQAIDRLYPQAMGQGKAAEQAAPQLENRQWQLVLSEHTGYVTAVNTEDVLQLAVDCNSLVWLHVAVGDFITEGAALASFSGAPDATEAATARLRKCLVLGEQRTVEQDAAYGLQQLADVAVKALSPGINDPTTACLCIDRLGGLLGRLASREMPSPYRSAGGELRVIAPAPDFAQLVDVAFESVVQHSRGDLKVSDRLVQAVELIAKTTQGQERRQCLACIARDVEAQLREQKALHGASERILRARQLWQLLEG